MKSRKSSVKAPEIDVWPWDEQGHGTHTASTAAGNYVKDVSFYEFADGIARGGVPSARIASYKVCFRNIGCQSADILAAFDGAIADGVDIITISLGASIPLILENDAIGIGSLHASQKGILVVHAAGNEGLEGCVLSTVPWIFSVALGFTDREFITKVVLRNGTVITVCVVLEIIAFTNKFVSSHFEEILTIPSYQSFRHEAGSNPLGYGKELSSICNEQDTQSVHS
ncbi:cucumisin-like [Dorcoceras hygrometricum]|uniref:Cucumisin-like n=1 Tax=Dorcoceras hygrometricum TaxID=472368 RepID=A0A2Z6ZVV9_9LAMI|nr:cucumisin-like [Dorcoceras hygrometricum]